MSYRWDQSKGRFAVPPLIGAAAVSRKKVSVSGPAISSPSRYSELREKIQEKLIGHEHVVDELARFLVVAEEMPAEERPKGSFLLVGPTGCGKTHTVFSVAHALHSSKRHVLRIDCGEYQLEHEVAKLIGAPPGYLGHRETHPQISQQKLGSVTSEHSDISVLLVDEIEKAHPSLCRLLLGVLDRGSMKLGDNTTVNFANTLVFMTSNLGVDTLTKVSSAAYSFQQDHRPTTIRREDAERICVAAVKKRFSPEFVNRIDRILSYGSITRREALRIARQNVEEATQLLALSGHRPIVSVTDRAVEQIADESFDPRYGAREINRVIMNAVKFPVCDYTTSAPVPHGARLVVDWKRGQYVVRELVDEGEGEIEDAA